MNVPVDLIIPDSGPLISLAHANRLDLVEVFDRPVMIADVVKLECLKKPGSPDHAVLDAWFKRETNRITMIETPMGDLYRSALDRERSGETPRATSGFGDATIAYIMRNLDRYTSPGSIPLVLLEDSKASILLARFERAHVLSTRTWLTSLERAGVIDSASAVIAKMAEHGRSLSTLQADRPARRDDDRSSWLTQILIPDIGVRATDKSYE